MAEKLLFTALYFAALGMVMSQPARVPLSQRPAFAALPLSENIEDRREFDEIAALIKEVIR